MKFLFRGEGYNLFLTDTEAVLALGAPAPASTRPARKGMRAKSVGRGPAVVRIKPVGANVGAPVKGTDELPGKSNYFVGQDPARWRANVPTYASVRYEGIYPGIDLVYHGTRKRLEYDFVVAPGADPAVIRLSLGGTRGLRVDAEGDLILSTAVGRIRQSKPVAYQEVGGERREVACGYRITGARRISFRVGEYDRSKPLVIDPVLVYSTFLGGSDSDGGHSIAVDQQGNAYVTGFTVSPDFPTANPVQPNLNGTRSDVFVTKLNPSGTALVYSTYVGGSVGDTGYGIDVDSAGNAYVAGTTGGSIDFNDFPTVNAYDPTYGGTDDAFLFKLDPSGSTLLFSTYLGGTSSEVASEVAVNRATGDAYVTGYTGNSNAFPITPGAYRNGCCNSFSAAFISKFTTGGGLAYSAIVGPGDANDIALDAESNAYITGSTISTLFPTTQGAFQTACTGCNFGRSDAFVTKLNAQGSALVYSTFLGGSRDDVGSGIAVDTSGSAYVTGQTESGLSSSKPFPVTPAAFQPADGGIPDAFVTKLTPDGTGLAYSTFLGGDVHDQGQSVAVDTSGNAYVTGATQSLNFPTARPIQPELGGIGSFDAFVTKLNAAGAALVYSTYLGALSRDEGFHIVLDSARNAYVTGQTFSAEFPTTPGAFQTSSDEAASDAFVSKIADPDAPAPAPAAQWVGYDVTTRGIWKGVYGAEGFEVVGDAASPPAYAQVGASGNFAWTWNASTDEVRALQKNVGPDRIAATWYNPASFTVELNLTDGASHRVALYFLDWDGGGRAQTVEVLDAATGAVLDSRSVSDFAQGQYMVWNLTGHVRLRLTRTAGNNAVLSGLFFDAAGTAPTPTPTPSPTPAPGGASAAFVAADDVTQGGWKTVYGGDGYQVIGDAASPPAYAQVTPTGHHMWTWAEETGEARALERAVSVGRVAATWYSASAFTVDVNLTDGSPHRVALYFLDWDGGGSRAQTVEALDAATGAVLDTRNVSDFAQGRYLVWDMSGNVRLRLTRMGGGNAVLSGLFFGAAGPQPTPTPNTGTATFVRADSATQGSWKTVYGADGYDVINDAVSIPAYAQVVASGQSAWSWESVTADSRALQKVAGDERIAAAWYTAGSLTLDVNLTDGRTHQVALYCLDWDGGGTRAQTVEVFDAVTGALLDTRSVSDFAQGRYLIWNLGGHVRVRLARISGSNAVLSGVFFDTPSF
ncbi:MAG TPA: SBBP repeat-containing protein [Pyrinomonadaceae bacterium]|nr:SBBP repeat-containing protein [Pyrinomonadaceae bacterium]